MLAADRAMYQAKSLGKNQISGNPRPRRLIGRVLPPASEPPVEPPSAPIELPPVAPPAAEAPDATPVAAATTLIAVDTAAHNRGPTVNLPIEPDAEQVPVAMGGDEEPDAAVVRGQIATARLSFDPDDQIRRAMDAFLSAPRDPSRGPDA